MLIKDKTLLTTHSAGYGILHKRVGLIFSIANHCEGKKNGQGTQKRDNLY